MFIFCAVINNMKYRNLPSYLLTSILCGLLTGVLSLPLRAQSANPSSTPLTSQELVRLVQQLPAHPEKKGEIVEELRRRGIGFTLTNGIRSVVATKSGNDALLRRTLEEAERRRLNPAAFSLPPEAEGRDLLEKTREATLAANGSMPDFVVKQQIGRSYARGNTRNWVPSDRLTVAVSYRESVGEQYKLLLVNGLPTGDDEQAGNSYERLGGTSSTGEFVSMLAALFSEASQARFKMIDTDLLRGRRTIVYEFEVKKPHSKQTIKAGKDQSIIVGYRGRVWIDREVNRVLRLEDIATEIPEDFPVSAATSTIDYDWVEIDGLQHLLPSRAEVVLTARRGEQAVQTRNEIRFRNYQKYGSKVTIIEEDDPPPPSTEP